MKPTVYIESSVISYSAELGGTVDDGMDDLIVEEIRRVRKEHAAAPN